MPFNVPVIISIVGVVVFLVLALFLLPFVNLLVMAWFCGARLSIFDLIGMRLRKVDPREIVLNRIRVVKAGLDVSIRQLETHFLAGGRVSDVVTALITARRAGIPLEWDVATAIDSAGRDALDVVEEAATERSAHCGEGTPPVIRAVAADGSPLSIRVELRYRGVIEREIDGATLETVLERARRTVTVYIGAYPDSGQLVAMPEILEGVLAEAELDRGAKVAITECQVEVERRAG